MPANLTQQYHKAEAAYRAAVTLTEQLECLQWMLREIPKHKGTDRLQADLKSKIAKLKIELQKSLQKGGLGSTSRGAHRIPRQGAGRALLIGPPNSGKSQLLASLTRAQPEIAPYPFTTQNPLPGMMPFEDCMIQLIDLPPVTAECCDGNMIELVRSADLVLLVLDLANDSLVEDTQAVLAHFSSGKTRFGRSTRLDPEDVGVAYTCTLAVLNKCDCEAADERLKILDEFLELPFDRIQISASTGDGLDALRRVIFENLSIVRVYTKHPNEREPDLTKPFTIRRGDTLVTVAEMVHQDVAASLKSARVWHRDERGNTGVLVKPDYQPVDGDIVELLNHA